MQSVRADTEDTKTQAKLSIAVAPATTEKEGFRPDIEGLRGIAVALVIFFHAGLLSGAAWLVGGFIGVDLFFVVSGFLITGLLIRERERNGRISFSRFYARRVRRILPAATVCLIITIPVAYTLVTLIGRPEAMLDGAAASLSFANIRFALTTDYFNPASYSPFLHFWSLGVEEQFYLVWPLVLLVAAWKRPRLGAGLALGAICLASFAASVIMTNDNPSWAFYMLPTRAWQLAAGGLLAVGAGTFSHLRADWQPKIALLLTFAGWVALGALLLEAATLNSASTPYPGLAALVPTLAAMALIVSGPQRFGPGMLLRLSPLRYLGKISYSLYLWHWPFLILGGLALGATSAGAGAGDVSAMLSPAQAVGLALLSIPAATLSWALIEEPFRRGHFWHLNFSLPRPGKLVAAGVVTMVLVSLLSTGLSLGAQSDLNTLDGSQVSSVTPTDAPGPASATNTPSPAVTPSPLTTPDPTATNDPTPTPVPQMTPALTPAEPSAPSSYAVAGLRPSLGHAATDYEITWHDGCLGRSSTANIPAASKCIYGDPAGTYSVVLIGDSHASALLPGVDAMAKAHGWKLTAYVKVDCKFIDGPIYDDYLKRQYTECATWNKQVLARLAANPPDLILVSMDRYIEGLDSSDSSPSAQGAAIGREIKKLPAASTVMIIEDIPAPLDHNVPSCLSNHISNYRSCAYPRSGAFGIQMGVREKIAAKNSGAGLIDLTASICPGSGACPAVINGMIVFRDEHHLTATFSASLGPALDAQVVDFLVTSSATPAPPPYAGAQG